MDAKAELIEADLPLERRGSGQDWYYACSFCEAKWAEESVTHWHKRSTLNERIRYLGTDAGKLDVSKGETKAYRMPLYLLHAGERLTWYAVGDMAWVTDRIETVTTIGKKRTAGHGAVVDWQVEPVTEDWSVAKGERLMRAVPFGEAPSVVTEFAVGSYALRPPYWHYDHQRPNLLIPALPRAA